MGQVSPGTVIEELRNHMCECTRWTSFRFIEQWLLIAWRRAALARGRGVCRTSWTTIVVRGTIVIAVIVTSVIVGVWNAERKRNIRFGNSKTWCHLQLMSSANKLSKLTMVWTSAWWVCTTWGIVVVTLAVGSGSAWHFQCWNDWESESMICSSVLRIQNLWEMSKRKLTAFGSKKYPK